ncbi:Uma2 family endonuclease [Nostoc sp. FACHB-87]|uniref:Uma2 family endonuclease n=1 Tax=Nostocales TaxID=1161 RepID=UPI001689EB72|nr:MULTISPECIES: Uma2 family endonuclease [Nostocales]MBD2297108.1 Uma2 family endonuclease [Nostoc sp. FACHB-190]MBD2454909.1 Uma2 family endonuclease [Nostoc sp. FACHB-87]MBD2474770.1 Uma2 family endonuclease [Anabaena sp. FACHB-83]MBD2488112.1 Uma2 family endonuclease [Aulosira sp. FACHB-615]
MTQALRKTVTFAEFVSWKPDGELYELHDGVVVKMAQPLGGHEEVTGFLSIQLAVQCYQSRLPYLIPKTALVKPIDSESAYSPDILILNQANLMNEPLWQQESTVSQAASIPLVIEVVSSNWRDDYYKKYGEYEGIGIREYWIVDYLGLAAKKFVGDPKQPTISIYSLVDDEYQVIQFKGDDCIESPTFPELNLTAKQIFQAGS